ncbi:MAG: head GIN domain-containing protein [Pseudomonadota bacterium]
MRHLLLLAILPLATLVHAEEQSRSLGAYSSINIRGPISLAVDAGKAHTLTVRGNKDFIDRVVTEVVDGRLNISYLHEDNKVNVKGDARILITLPMLAKLTANGAGETILSHMEGERLDIVYNGAGRLEASGKVKVLHLTAQGVGEVDTHALIAEDADVNFNGIGAVKVYANGRLNAVVRGMGDLIYYGKPRSVNKSVAGIGSVKAGD